MARETKHTATHTSPAEWIVAILSTIFVLALLAYTTYEGVTRGDAPPVLSVQVDSIAQTRDGFIVMFTISNHGDGSASDVHVGGVLRSGDTVLERSEARIDYVPVDAERTGVLLFTRDPRRHTLEIRPTGFELP